MLAALITWIMASTVGRWIAGTVAALAVAVGIVGGAWLAGDLHGAHRVQAKWDAAKAAEWNRETAAGYAALANEAHLDSVTKALNDTVDQLEKAREDAQAKAPAAPDCIDDAAAVGELQHLIDGK